MKYPAPSNSKVRILVRAPNWIGDQILAYPFFNILRKNFPEAYIAATCVPWVEAVQFRKQVDDVIVLPLPKDRSLFARWNALEEASQKILKRGPWDLGICLPNSFSSAWIFFRAGVLTRRGYAADGRSWLLHEKLELDQTNIVHRSDAYLRLIFENQDTEVRGRAFFGERRSSEDDCTEIERPSEVLPDRRFDPSAEWVGYEPFSAPKNPYWVLAPGTTAESRQWPLEYFKKIARQFATEKGWQGLVLGGPKEKRLAEKLTQDPSLKLEDWTGKGSVASYWKIFAGARLTLSNDSGLAHVASLCGSPVQVVWGAGNPKRTEPLGPGKVQVSLNPVSCWPCERNVCFQSPPSKLECLNGLDPQSVWEEIQSGFRS